MPVRGLQELPYSAPSLVRKNVTAASSPTCSLRTGGGKATTSRFAISPRLVRNPQERAAKHRAPRHDQAAHHGNHPHGPGLLCHRPPARERQHSIHSSCHRNREQLAAFPLSSRRRFVLRACSLFWRQTPRRRSRRHSRFSEGIRRVRGGRRQVAAKGGSGGLAARLIWLRSS